MAELFSLTSLYILLGVVGGLAVLGAVVWAARRAIGQHGSANETGDEKRQGLLSEDAVVIAVADSGDAQLCAICKGRLEGPCRRLRPCGHLYHAECIDLWLERKRICPLCRAGVVALRTETIACRCEAQPCVQPVFAIRCDPRNGGARTDRLM